MRKIADLPKAHYGCQDPQHRPPICIVIEPGIYEHECPSCHEKQTVVELGRNWRPSL